MCQFAHAAKTIKNQTLEIKELQEKQQTNSVLSIEAPYVHVKITKILGSPGKEWINNLSYAHDVNVDHPYIKPNEDTLGITAIVENPNQHDLSVMAFITEDDSVIVDSCYLYNDGNHHHL